MSKFPVLFGKAESGKTKSWSICVIDRDGYGVIETSYGYVDGKQQINEKVISTGKNIGKKNETTPIQQAINDARSSWTKKCESGYAVEDMDDISITIEKCGKGIDVNVPCPMLAHDYNKRGKSITYPCFVQRKFDGTRCVGMYGKGLFSRNRKRYPHLDHITTEINKLPSGIILDGELYSDTLTFQEIVGLVKRETLKEGDIVKQLQIKYHIYDIINDMPFEERFANLQLLFKRHGFKHLVLVNTTSCESEDKMKELHAQYVAEGYEGIMLRNKYGLYKNVRSIDLQKFKLFEDDEFKVVGYKEGEGLELGCVIWICENSDGNTFACRPRGTREERENLYRNGDKYIGQMLTVRYQEKTDSGLIRFPVGITFRDYE